MIIRLWLQSRARLQLNLRLAAAWMKIQRHPRGAAARGRVRLLKFWAITVGAVGLPIGAPTHESVIRQQNSFRIIRIHIQDTKIGSKH